MSGRMVMTEEMVMLGGRVMNRRRVMPGGIIKVMPGGIVMPEENIMHACLDKKSCLG